VYFNEIYIYFEYENMTHLEQIFLKRKKDKIKHFAHQLIAL